MARQFPEAMPPEPFVAIAADGYPVRGFMWRHRAPASQRPVTIINCATSVRCRYYFRFATYLFGQGRDVLVYDYRGIGESRPARLAGFDATWLDWGRFDCEAVLQFALQRFPGQPLDLVAHSIGGFALGLAASSAELRRVFTVGAQYAYWRDCAPAHRFGMLLKWYLAMPALAHLLGYVPAKRLGWMEDTPKGVALSWSRCRPRFEDTYVRTPLFETEETRRELVARFARVSAPILAVGLDDDEFGTVEAIERLLAYYARSEITHVRIAPREIGVPEIGHFAFFHARFAATLWPLALHWLQDGALPAGAPGEIVRRPAESVAGRRA